MSEGEYRAKKLFARVKIFLLARTSLSKFLGTPLIRTERKRDFHGDQSPSEIRMDWNQKPLISYIFNRSVEPRIDINLMIFISKTLDKNMSTVVIDGLDNRTTSDTVKIFCQNFGRVLNCYIKSNQCIVTFADKHHAEEFIRASPHRIDANGFVNATWKTTLNRNFPSYQRPPPPTTANLNDICRLTIRGTSEQLEEKSLIRYFSHYGPVRMCLANPLQGSATITFDDRLSYERALKEPRHFLNGRSLIVEPYVPEDETESTKRMKFSDPNQSTLSVLTSRFEHEKEQLLNEQIRLQNQFQERIQLYEYEKQQWNEYMLKQQNDFHQQIGHYQYLLKQSLDEITNKDKQIEQLKQENKDIEYED